MNIAGVSGMELNYKQTRIIGKALCWLNTSWFVLKYFNTTWAYKHELDFHHRGSKSIVNCGDFLWICTIKFLHGLLMPHWGLGLGMGLDWAGPSCFMQNLKFSYKLILNYQFNMLHSHDIRLLYLFLQVSQKFRLRALTFSVDLGNGKIFNVKTVAKKLMQHLK